MLNLTVRNLLNACQNDLASVNIRRIDPYTHTSYDPEEDTDLIYSGGHDGLNALASEEVQDFSIDQCDYGAEINIYI